MKKYILLYIGIILSMLTACQHDDIVVSYSKDNTTKFTFKVNIPKTTILSRTFNDGQDITIQNLYLLLFDENGILKGNYKAATFPQNNIDEGDEYEYTVELPETAEKRIIHFIANCPTIYEQLPSSGTEAEIIQSLKSIEKNDAYWQRIEVPSIIKDDDIPTVYLIRNFAAVQVTQIDGLNFLQAYDLVNVPQRGTVAPFYRNAEGGFVNYLKTDEETTTITTYNYDELTRNGYYGVEPANNTYAPLINDLPADITNTNELYLYERNHKGVDAMDITFLIVKGYYNDSEENNGDDIWYYRVDFAENFEYLNILRNFRYVITIKSVTGKGYTSPELAAKGNSVNNIDVAIEVEEITDGTHTLFVSPTAKTVLNGTKTITINYATDEEYVTCIAETATETSGAFSSVSPSRKGDDDNGTITVNMKDYSDGDGVPNGKQNQTFKVKTPSGLYREVKITLIDGFEFENVTFTRNATTGNYEYSFTIPKGLEKSMFPLELFLFEESCSFSPLGDAMSVKLKEDDKNDGRQTWGYSATLDWEDYNATYGSTYTYQFVANSPITTDKTMTISNDFAKADGTATYDTPIAQITIADNDGTQDGVLSWNANDTEQQTQEAIVTITDGYTWNVISTLTAFEYKISNNKIFITPKTETSRASSDVSETLMVQTNETNGNTASLTLQIVTSKKLTIEAGKLIATYDSNMGNNNDDKTINIYTDEKCTELFATCIFSKKNNTWSLKEQLTLTIPSGINTLYFARIGGNNGNIRSIAEVSVEVLESASKGTQQSLKFEGVN